MSVLSACRVFPACRLAWAMFLGGIVLSPLAAQQPADPPPDAAAGKTGNLLGQETSPYLLSHANNPVHWRPWNEDSLAAARRENKVIFLSIGYSSCHWCHVMERESFMDQEIAAFLNRHFICIKVDREERPDIDSIYMTALQVYNQLTQNGRGGGWPLSMFLTPDAEPFVGGSYFPARDGDRGAATGFLTLIRRVHELWSDQPQQIVADAQTVTRFVKRELEGQALVRPATPEATVVAEALDELQADFDSQHGGFGYDERNPLRPKFPEPANLFFLIDQIQQAPPAQRPTLPAYRMLIASLDAMARGGIRDHLGGGFHRYSVDRFWRIPHFEKMLYDNGQLLSVYAEAHALTGRLEYRRVCEQIIEFLQREMLAPGGGFYSALDADSEHEEGKFYRWTRDEVRQALTAEEYSWWGPLFGLDQEPNFEEQWYAVQRSRGLAEAAEDRGLSAEALATQLDAVRTKLLAVRDRRVRPATDTKILTSWNGLLIRGLADAARTLDDPRSLDLARNAAEFLWREMRDEQGRLRRTYSQGRPRLNAYLDDYAMFIDGMLALHQASREAIWLERAIQLQQTQDELFSDPQQGGYFFTSKDHESLLARAKNPVDGATPSGNSVSAGNLLQLHALTGQPRRRELAEGTLRSANELLLRRPSAAIRMAVAVRRFHDSQPNQ